MMENSNRPEEQNPRPILAEDRDAKFKPFSHFFVYALIAAVSIIIILFLIGIIPRIQLQDELAKEAAKISLPRVTVMEAKGIDTPSELILPSSIDAINMTPIWSRVSGYIKTFYHDIGDKVKKGTILAEIETPELDQQFSQAVADIAVAMARKNIAEITADRWKDLYKEDPEAISKQDVDQKIADLEAAVAAVAAAEANALRLKETLDFKFIQAPFDGIIISRNIDIGSLITAGSSNSPQQLFKIARSDILRVFVNVPQRFFRQIQKNLAAEVTINEFQGHVFAGKVARYAKALDPIARTLLTEVHIKNPKGELYVGLYAQVKFLLKPETPYFLIPTSALLIRAQGPQIAIVDANHIVHIKPVVLGLDYGKMIEIISGLQEHDQIITVLSDKIVEGAKVEIVTPKPKDQSPATEQKNK